MRIYEIYDDELNTALGCLLYYEGDKSFVVELCENVNEWTAPLLFTKFVKDKVYTIPRDSSLKWVTERIIPSNRQNIGSILKTHKLNEYDEMKLLELSKGRSSLDALSVKCLETLPAYIQKRQKLNIRECVLLRDGKFLCFFFDGTAKKVDLDELKDMTDVEKVIKNDRLRKSYTLLSGGYGITFNDSIDIPAAVLYDRGRKINVSLEDFIDFMQNNILDTSEGCKALDCTRQNLSYMVNQGRISPVKVETKGNLYLKGDIKRLKS